jgi:hypothetical protein
MQNKDNFRSSKHEGDSLGKSKEGKNIKENPAPKEADKESETTPKENEVYVDLEPDELHIGDEDVEEVDKKE